MLLRAGHQSHVSRAGHQLRHRGVADAHCKARDKAKAEAGVLLVERWILARLRKHTFFSLGELNSEIHRLLDLLNDRPFHKLDGTRRSLYEVLDRPALRPLSAVRYEYAQWKKARVNVDYHIEVFGHYYSVPHALYRKQMALPARLDSVAGDVRSVQEQVWRASDGR